MKTKSLLHTNCNTSPIHAGGNWFVHAFKSPDFQKSLFHTLFRFLDYVQNYFPCRLLQPYFQVKSMRKANIYAYSIRNLLNYPQGISMNTWFSASVSHSKTFFRVTNVRGRENRLPEHIYLWASWKATLRKELLSERDGNLNKPHLLSLRRWVPLRKELLSERDGNHSPRYLQNDVTHNVLGRNYSLKEMETKARLAGLISNIIHYLGRNYSLKEMETFFWKFVVSIC